MAEKEGKHELKKSITRGYTDPIRISTRNWKESRSINFTWSLNLLIVTQCRSRSLKMMMRRHLKLLSLILSVIRVTLNSTIIQIWWKHVILARPPASKKSRIFSMSMIGMKIQMNTAHLFNRINRIDPPLYKPRRLFLVQKTMALKEYVLCLTKRQV